MIRLSHKNLCNLLTKSSVQLISPNCKVSCTTLYSSSSSTINFNQHRVHHYHEKRLSTSSTTTASGGPGPPRHSSNPNLMTLPEKLVYSAPPSWQPYLRLSRVDRPIGTWLLLWPSTWGLALGAGGVPPLPLLSLFAAGAFVMRSAGCSINDIWDRKIDPKVARTASRPLASGQLTFKPAMAWTGAQLSVALAILISLQSPACFILGIGSLGLVVIYPLAKRFTNWPQAVLGLTFNTGILMGFTAAGSFTTLFPWLDPSCMAFYLAGNFWTLIYDTIYAHQDIKDDALLGLGSTARKFGENSKYWLTGFACSMVSSLVLAGYLSDLHWPFYTCVGATSLHLFWQIKTLDIHQPTNCGARFTSNRNLGWIILAGILGSYWIKKYAEKKGELLGISPPSPHQSIPSPNSLLSHSAGVEDVNVVRNINNNVVINANNRDSTLKSDLISQFKQEHTFDLCNGS